MKIVFSVLAVFLVIIGLGAVVGMFLPSQIDVSTSVEIQANAADVFTYINDLERWEEWTAWTTEQYPDMERTFGDKKAGEGGKMMWQQAGGAGELTIVSSDPSKGIEFDLSFEGGEPFRSAIALEEEAGVTTVTWSMKGERPFLLRYFPMESAIKGDYDTGLAKLKSLAGKNGTEAPKDGGGAPEGG